MRIANSSSTWLRKWPIGSYIGVARALWQKTNSQSHTQGSVSNDRESCFQKLCSPPRCQMLCSQCIGEARPIPERKPRVRGEGASKALRVRASSPKRHLHPKAWASTRVPRPKRLGKKHYGKNADRPARTYPRSGCSRRP